MLTIKSMNVKLEQNEFKIQTKGIDCSSSGTVQEQSESNIQTKGVDCNRKNNLTFTGHIAMKILQM